MCCRSKTMQPVLVMRTPCQQMFEASSASQKGLSAHNGHSCMLHAGSNVQGRTRFGDVTRENENKNTAFSTVQQKSIVIIT